MTSEQLRPPRAPRPEPERLSALVARVDQGDIKLPTFQRRQVWNIGQVIDLLDSVNQGYPIGSLLMWQTHTRLKSERNIGGFLLPETPELYPRNYVLDGQQRLTALYAVLKHHPDRLHERFRVVYDLEERAFVQFDPSPSRNHITLNLLYDAPRFHVFLRGLEDGSQATELSQECERLWETFHEYVVPVVTIEQAPIDQVGVIFERINSRGTRLTIFDLMVAATWAAEGEEEFNLRDSVDTVLEQLEGKDFGGIEDVTVLRCLSVIARGSARRQQIVGLRDLGHQALRLQIEKTRASLARAVDFLATEVSVASSDFLPYERQVVLLTYVMSKRDSLDAKGLDELRRWFWRTSFAERYRTGGEALFDEDMTHALSALAGTGGVGRFGKPPNADFFSRTQFRKGAAAAQAFAAFLARKHPLNLTNGAEIDTATALSEYNRREFHHLFPQSFLRNTQVDRALIGALANICMLASSENKKIGSRPPSEYVAELREKHGDRFDGIMESNLVSKETVERLLADDYPGFLTARAEHLTRLVAEVV